VDAPPARPLPKAPNPLCRPALAPMAFNRERRRPRSSPDGRPPRRHSPG
jgi:hypothetical protein